MNTKEALQQGNFDITNWLDEKKLGKTLDIIFPDEIFIHDKAVPNSGTRKRPDYTYDSIFGSGTGKLGRIYMEEVGMHMYLPHCDVYDTEILINCYAKVINLTKLLVSFQNS